MLNADTNLGKSRLDKIYEKFTPPPPPPPNLRQGWEGVLSEVIGSFILVSLAAIFVSFCKAPPHCVTKQKQRLQVRAASSNVFGGGGGCVVSVFTSFCLRTDLIYLYTTDI